MKATVTRRVLTFIVSMAMVVGLTPSFVYADLVAGENAVLQAADTPTSEEAVSLASGELALDAENQTDTWSGLQSKINEAKNGDTITLSQDYTAGSSDTRLKIPENKTITIDLAGHTLNRNLASKDSQTDGGNVIELQKKSVLTIEDSVGTGKITGGYPKNGGGIHVREHAILNFKGGTIINNRASNAGGGIYVAGALNMMGGTIDNNTSYVTGGGIYAEADSAINLSNAIIKNNEARGGYGGGLDLRQLYDSSITNCEISNNTASTVGGGLHLDSKHGTLTIVGTAFNENSSTQGGGGMYLRLGTVTMDSASSLTGNIAGTYGGGVLVMDDAVFKATGVTISGNKARSAVGGGIGNSGTTELKDCSITNNTAGGNGGGVYSEKSLRIIGETALGGSTKISHNIASKGGGIYVDSSAKATEIEGDISVTNNAALGIGQDVFLQKGKVLTLTGTLAHGAQMSITMESSTGTFTSGYLTHCSEYPSFHFYSPEGYDIDYDESMKEVRVASFWQELQDEIDATPKNGTVTIGRYTKAASSNKRLKVDKSITLDLAGHTLDRGLENADDSKSDGNVLEVSNGATLTIVDNSTGKTGKITGGYAEKGGGIYVNKGAKLIFQSGTVIDNRASVDGGGIYVSGDLSMTGGTIEGNTAKKSGGGIYADSDSKVDLSSAVIIKNKTNSHDGGGVSLRSQNDSSITDCTITDNSAKGYGGGLSLDSKNKTLTIKNTTIDRNSSSNDGGGIQLRNGTIQMSDGSSLSGNSADDNGGGINVTSGTSFFATGVTIGDNETNDKNGGGVGNEGTTELKDCTVAGNTAGGNGGGIFSNNTLRLIGDTQNDGSETVSRNTAKIGGGIYIDEDATITEIEGNIDVMNNDSQDSGKEIYLGKGQVLTLSGTLSHVAQMGVTMEDGIGTFTFGYSSNCSEGPGAHFYSPEGCEIDYDASEKEAQIVSHWTDLQNKITATPENGTVTLDRYYAATSNDSCLKVDKNLTIDLAGHTLNRNLSSSKDDGSVIKVGKDVTLTIVDNSTGKTGKITGGYAKQGGGIYVSQGATLNVAAGTVSDNNASKDGGGIYVEGSLSMTGGTIEGNTASTSGGGIFVSDKHSSKLQLENVTITANTASASGGGIGVLPTQDSTIKNCEIVGNTAKQFGGGVLMSSSGAKLTIEGTAIDGNTSNEVGGGIHLGSGTITMKTGSSLSGNIADRSGGGAQIEKGASFDATGVVIVGNKAATYDGGGVSNYGTTKLKSCTVRENGAKCGGGAFNNGTLTLDSCSISGNNAEENGGGVYSKKALSVAGGNVSENSASNRGGGIFIEGGSNTGIQGALQVRDNEASICGNDMYLSSGQKLTLAGKLDEKASIGVDLESGTGILTKDYKKSGNTAEPSKHFVVATGYYLNLQDGDDGEVEITNDWASIKAQIEGATNGKPVDLGKDYAAGPHDDVIQIPAGADVTVNLNGHTLNRNRMESDDSGQVFEVRGTLTITDGSAEKTGDITGGWAPNGGGIQVTKTGVLNLQGGTITGNKANCGGGVSVQGILNMEGGAIKANESQRKKPSFEGSGGGVYVAGTGALNLQGGSITDNKADASGGGIMVAQGAKVSVEGGPVVQGNNAVKAGHDIYLPYGIMLDITGTLTADALMGVALEKGLGTFTSGYGVSNKDEDPALYFMSTEGYSVLAENGEAKMNENTYGETEYAKPFIDRDNQISVNSKMLTSQNWMSGISGDRYLHEINMPGSHDSGMKNVIPTEYLADKTGKWCFLFPNVTAYFATTQVEYIDQQLEEGARQLDLRLNDCYKKKDSKGHYQWEDDHVNLWISHGTTYNGGNYLASNSSDSLLSFSQVLDWVKEFLQEHPTETIILNVRPETNQSGHSDLIYQRARRILEILALEKNPSTGEPYLYKEPGSSSYFAKYSHMPQLKDCRGKIVLLPGSDSGLDALGGFRGDSFKDIAYVSPTDFKLTPSEKITEVEREYKKLNPDGNVKLPTNADTHFGFLWYWETNCTGEDQGEVWNYIGIFSIVRDLFGKPEAGENPVKIARTVNPGLYGDGKLLGPDKTGQYIGWVRMDAFEAKYAEAVWRTNFPDDLQYCTVTVKSGLDDPNYATQTYRVLKGSSIVIPGNIYKQLKSGVYLNSWKAAEENTDTICYPGDTFKVDEDVTFTAQWLEEGQVPVSIEWKDANDLNGLRAESVSLIAKAGDGKTNEITLTSSKGWSGGVASDTESIVPDWECIDVTDDHPYGEDAVGKYRYAVEPLEGGGFLLTFYHTPQATVPISGTVTWSDNDNSDGLRPGNATIRLLVDGSQLATTTVVGDGWQYGFDGYPQYANGEEIEYVVAEDGIDGYSTIVNGFSVTNVHVASGQNDVEVMGIITWDDADNVEGARPESVTVRLLGNGTEVASQEVTLGDHNLWSYVFEAVPISDENGEPITYSVNVDEVAGYVSSTEAFDDYAFLTTNTLDIPDDKKELTEITEAPEANELVYAGSAQQLVEGGRGTGGTILYALGADDMTAPSFEGFSNLVPTGTDVGTYYVWYYMKGDAYHKDTKPECVQVVIDKRLVTFTGKSGIRYYTGEELQLTGVWKSGLVSGQTHNVEFSAKGIDVGLHRGRITAKGDVVIMDGEVDVTANYNVAVVNGVLTVTQNPDLTLQVSLEGANFTYDGSPHALLAAATTNASTGTTTIEYSKDGEAWTEDLSTLTATDVADSCTVKVRASNPNYANAAEGSAELAIQPAKATITVDDASKVKGEADPAFAGKVEGLVADGDLGEIKYVRTNDDEAPGAYEGVLTATYTPNPNYDVKVVNGDFTITAPSYSVRFDANVPADASTACSGSMEDERFAYDEQKALSENEYTLPGYGFGGWNTEADGTGTAYADGAEVEGLSDDGGVVVLYAQWSAKTYRIVFQSDDAGSQKHVQTARFDQPGRLDAYSDEAFGWDSGTKQLHEWTVTGFGPFYEDGEDFCNLCGAPDAEGNLADAVLTAYWVQEGQIAITVTRDGMPQGGLEECFTLVSEGVTFKVPFEYRDGRYAFDPSRAEGHGGLPAQLPSGTYELKLDAPGYPPASTSITYGDAYAVSAVFDYYTVSLTKDAAHAGFNEAEISGGAPVAGNPSAVVALDGDTLSIKTTVGEGYRFESYTAVGVAPVWEGGDPSKAEQAVQVQGQVDIMAHVAPIEYSVAVEGGKADKATAHVGDTVTITADEPEPGKAFVQWARADGVGFADASSVTTTFVMPAKDVAATATFAPIVIGGIEGKVYTGEPIKPFDEVEVSLDGVDLDLTAEDYEVSFDDNVDAGTATAIVAMKAPRAGSATATFEIAPRPATITVDSISKVEGEADQAFAGKVEGLVADDDLGEIKYVRTNDDEAPGTYEGVLTATYTPNPNYDVKVVNGDFTIKARLTAVWLDGDESELVRKDYGEGDPIPEYDGKEPAKAATAQCSYEFTGWDDGTVEGATTTFRPQFSRTVKKYKVTFVDYDGKTVLKEAVEYGYGTPAADVARPADPTRKADAQYTYKFAGWTPEVADVTADAVYTAVYESGKRSYEMTWLQDDGALIDKTTVEYGEKPAHADPAKAATAQYTYAFKGWEPEISPVIDDATYKAVYDATPITGTLTFDLAGGTLDGKTGTITVVANVGDMVKLPGPPTREGYAFKFWKGSEYEAGADYEVEGDHAFTAEWERTASVTHTVTFDANGHGTAPAAQAVEDGKAAARPANPAAAGWTFGGWFTDRACMAAYDFTKPVTADLVLYAKWTQASSGGTTTTTDKGATAPAKTGDGSGGAVAALSLTAACALCLLGLALFQRRRHPSDHPDKHVER